MPGANVGTLSLSDLLKRRDISPLKLGLDVIQRSLDADMAIHNKLLNDLYVAPYAVTTNDIRRRYGVGSSIRGSRADEFGSAHTQKVVTSSVVDFPLDGIQYATGWTSAFFKQKTVADMAITQQAIQVGQTLDVLKALKEAFYLSTNYTFTDYRDTGIDLSVKRLANADGAPIPNGPNGEVFDGATHTHYLAEAALDVDGANALINTVLEHYAAGPIRVFINIGNEAAWRGLTGFLPLTDVRLTLPVTAATPLTRLEPFNPNNRQIGLFGAAEIWVKPWAIAGYAVCVSFAPGIDSVLAARTRDGGPIRLETVADNVAFPLQARFMESEYGFGVWNRVAAAVLDHAHADYTDPTIT